MPTIMIPRRPPSANVRARLKQLVAFHTEAAPRDIDDSSRLWDFFPLSDGPREAPTVSAFVSVVQTEFSVFLTEEEWEDPTLADLADAIAQRFATPGLNEAARAQEAAGVRKGAIVSFTFFNLLGFLSFFAAEGSHGRRLALAGALVVSFNVILGIIYIAEARRTRDGR